MRHCSHADCGGPIPDAARYCPRCGRRARGPSLVPVYVAICMAFGVMVFLIVIPESKVPRPLPPTAPELSTKSTLPVYPPAHSPRPGQ